MLREIQAKSILNKTKHRDPWFLGDYTLNPYSGCSFNCLYCYIRGSKYGTHMEEKLSVKINAPDLLEKQLALRARKGQHGIIVLASSTDAYFQVEKDLRLTRQLLEIILRYRFPLHVITKSDLVVRDIDLLREIEKQAILPRDLEGTLQRKVFVSFSFSTLDSRISKIFEPGATHPALRLQAMQKMLQEGFHSGVNLMPLLPYISDTPQELTKIYNVLAETKINYIFPASMTLFGEGPSDSKFLVFEAVRKHFPELLKKYQALFEGGFQVLSSYQKDLEKMTKELNARHGLKNSLF